MTKDVFYYLSSTDPKFKAKYGRVARITLGCGAKNRDLATAFARLHMQRYGWKCCKLEEVTRVETTRSFKLKAGK